MNSTYLLINRRNINKVNDLENFTLFLKNKQNNSELEIDSRSASLGRTIIIPTQMETAFIDLIFHVLSLLEYTNIPIYIVSPIFNKLELLINIQSEWLNKDFCTISEPFPIRQYKHLHVIDTFNDDFKEGDKIIFCNAFYYELFSKRRIFSNQVVALINHDVQYSERYIPVTNPVIFTLKMESDMDEILSGYKGQLITSDSCFICTDLDYEVVSIDSNVNVINGDLFISGKMMISDVKNENNVRLSIKDKKCWLKKLIDAGNFVILDGWFVFMDEKIKCRIVNNYQIEYEYFN